MDEGKLFFQQLAEKLKAKGIPMLEEDLMLLSAELFKHTREFQYSNPLVSAIAVAGALALEPLAKRAIDKIDPSEERA